MPFSNAVGDRSDCSFRFCPRRGLEVLGVIIIIVVVAVVAVVVAAADDDDAKPPGALGMRRQKPIFVDVLEGSNGDLCGVIVAWGFVPISWMLLLAVAVLTISLVPGVTVVVVNAFDVSGVD